MQIQFIGMISLFKFVLLLNTVNEHRDICIEWHNFQVVYDSGHNSIQLFNTKVKSLRKQKLLLLSDEVASSLFVNKYRGFELTQTEHCLHKWTTTYRCHFTSKLGTNTDQQCPQYRHCSVWYCRSTTSFHLCDEFSLPTQPFKKLT